MSTSPAPSPAHSALLSATGPLSEAELDTLQALLDSLPATLEPLDM